MKRKTCGCSIFLRTTHSNSLTAGGSYRTAIFSEINEYNLYHLNLQTTSAKTRKAWNEDSLEKAIEELLQNDLSLKAAAGLQVLAMCRPVVRDTVTVESCIRLHKKIKRLCLHLVVYILTTLSKVPHSTCLLGHCCHYSYHLHISVHVR